MTVDTGGTKTLVAGFDKDGKPKEQFRFATPRDTDEYIAKLTEVIRDHHTLSEITGISIAVPGIVKENKALWCGNLGWTDFAVAKAIKSELRVPIWVENDANLAGLAQAHALSPLPEKCLYITISTGIGTGFIYNGEINPSLSTSEAGHMLFEYDGKLQEWEAFASGRAILDTYGKMARDIHSPSIWREFADKLSHGLLAIIPLTQPEVIIIGGSVGTYLDRYQLALEEALRARLNKHLPFPRIIQAFHPEEAVIYGCYQYAVRNPSLAT